MEQNGWVKLYRKISENQIIRDSAALQIFIWLLVNVDRKNGHKRIGRFWLSEELGLNASTFYKALQRLSKKYKVVTLSSNNKSTEISLIHWDKYQSNGHTVTPLVTTKEQQSNNKVTLYKNIRSKEYKNIYISQKNNFSSLKDLTPEVTKEIAEKYKVPESLVNLQHEKLVNWVESKGKTYKNYKRALMNWVLAEAQKQVEGRRNNNRYGYTEI